ncbi:MAG: preprotein translocase subunit YajC [Novosphingobium pentaromativorans]|uniref:Preprotein translocase subunit YajC n=1 Tax=Novosphingobium pentaromativorans TaxID=205844 RepID=A0A2W5NQN1_9SPHN|nr:preprotein translocase subunit YajC [Novosphingobium panipatense]PZQ55831.1 MAG: preprotein translocase subunit YajC [Novosphingobium pentaromativorans]
MMSRQMKLSGLSTVTLATALAAVAAPPVQAQTMGYDQVGSASDEAAAPADGGDAQRKSGRGGKGSRRLEVTPYIEIDQIVDAQLSPGNDVLTYTQLAAGVDAGISGRNNAVSASVRYERYIGWGKKARSGDAISGLVRGYATITPGLTFEAGALATQARVENGGSALSGGLLDDDTRTNIYSVYGGPSFKTRAGDIDLSANYRAGFTKVEQPDAYVAVPGGAAADLFDKSVSQMADIQAGVAPHVVAPVGLGVAGSFYQEDVSNLDQRVRDMQARALVTVPVSRTVQVVGAIGYEDVEVSSRDALRDADGNPVVGRDGRYVTDKGAPRELSYDVSGLLWDVAVMWRPSRRTSLSAHIGRRYGSTSFGGTLAYAPDDRSQLSVGVYDSISGFGGQLNRALDQLPNDFVAVRDPVTGELRGCVISLDGNNCLSGALGSVRSAVYRGRGIAASYSREIGHLNAGIGAGYDRRDFIAGRNTVLAAADGVVDENWWIAAYLSGELGRDAGWSANVYANWLSSSDALTGNVSGYGATLGYYRMLARRLRASVALGIDGTTRDDPLYDDYWTASALAGLRYSF